jgi:hypothetical protein
LPFDKEALCLTQARTKPPPQTTRDYLATLEHAIRTLSYGHHTFTIFRHFVELSAIALSNVADPSNKAAREAQYLAIVKQYTPEEVQQFPPMLGMLVACLEQETTDVLGTLYHRLALHNHQSGQFFTPYPLQTVPPLPLLWWGVRATLPCKPHPNEEPHRKTKRRPRGHCRFTLDIW